MEQNLAKLSLVYPEIIAEVNSIAGWNQLLDRGRIAAYSKPTRINFNAYKYVLYLDKSAEVVSAFLFNHRPQYASIMMQDQHLQITTTQVTPWASTSTIVTQSYFPLTKPREFDVFCVHLQIKKDTWGNFAVSPDTLGGRPGVVKGEIMYLGEVCEELDLHKCKLTIVQLVDPKGKVPAFLYTRVVEKMFAALEELLRYLTAYVF